MPRAVETAGLLQPVVGKGDLPIVQDRALSELFPGEADGLGWQEVVDRFGVPEWDTDPEMLIAPGGESWSGFVVRASEAVRALAERHPGEQVVAAVHAGVIESTMIANLAIPLADVPAGVDPHCARLVDRVGMGAFAETLDPPPLQRRLRDTDAEAAVSRPLQQA